MTGAGARTAPRLLVGSALSAAALTVLAVLVAAGSDAVGAFDAGARELAARAFGPSAGPWPGAGGRADLAGSTLLAVLVVAALGVLLVRRRFGAALWLLGGLTAQFVAETVLGPLVGRASPVPADGTPPDAGFSFPSGHAASATLAVVVLVAVARARTGTPLWWTWLGAGALLVLAVGVTRVIADAHHPADVVGGWLLGLTVGLAVAPRSGTSGARGKSGALGKS
ncbi:phosphatase PAP2 family protein [Streptomyces cyaneofuscatus]|uniref:phosphatase PAP2 family protein n=1 Tax=Streptomyces cyaneofuscatus TaxID=66883 RepID=UPI003687C0CA